MLPANARSSRTLGTGDGYVHDSVCFDLPYTLWNTCPLCVCGLLPVIVVCFSAVFQVDYATGVNQFGAALTNEIGLSYTVYYTAGCWPSSSTQVNQPRTLLEGNGLRVPASLLPDNLHCSYDEFEVAAVAYDAFSGSLLQVRNVTKLRALRMDAVKASPDWRFILFSGTLRPIPTVSQNVELSSGLNLWVVGADQTEAQRAAPLLSSKQLNAIQKHCSKYSSLAPQKVGVSSDQSAQWQVDAFHNLQIAPLLSKGSQQYRIAFSFECVMPDASTVPPLKFSSLAVIDTKIEARNATLAEDFQNTDKDHPKLHHLRYHANSKLTIIDLAYDKDVTTQTFRSYSCPRFVPSGQGHELLYVEEDIAPVDAGDSHVQSGPMSASKATPIRRLAVATIPDAPLQEAIAPLPVASRRLNGTSRGTGDIITSVAPAVSHEAQKEDHAHDKEHEAHKEDHRAHEKEHQAHKEDHHAHEKEHQAHKEEHHAHEKKIMSKAATTTTTATSTTAAASSTTTTMTTMTTTTTTTTTAIPTTTSFTFQENEDDQSAQIFYVKADTIMLELGQGIGDLPWAPVRGCPEFLPIELPGTEAQVSNAFEHLMGSMQQSLNITSPAGAFGKAEAKDMRKARTMTPDKFVFESNPSSYSVVGVDAQLVTASLPAHDLNGKVDDVKLLYNVGGLSPGLAANVHAHSLSGCQPIRAPGGWSLNKLMKKNTDPLVCVTADHRLAVVESPNPDTWFNMSLPYPVWTGRPPFAAWCPEGREDSCFEVWSS